MPTSTTKRARPSWKTIADLLERLGDIPPERVWLDPPPGTATEKDVIAAWSGPDRRLCELVQGTLVEKASGIQESALAGLVGHFIWKHLDETDLGLVLGAGCMFKLMDGLVRIPDVAFIAWDHLPDGELPDEAIASVVPELAAEVIRSGNTPNEIADKVTEYFDVGVKRVWLIYPKTQTAEELASPTQCRHIAKTQALDGRDVLPGFSLPLKQLFAGVKRRGKQK